MGDRTTLFVEVLKSDRDAVVKLFGEPAQENPDTSGPSSVFLVFDEVNYGGSDRLADLARSGVAFSARHEEGYDYWGMTFAACKGRIAEVASPFGELMVSVDGRTLEPSASELDELRRWREIEDSVRALFATAAPSSSA